MDYWDEAAKVLASRDGVLSRVIAKFDGDRLRGSGDAFTTLANAIVGQQISVAAAAGIWGRLKARYPDFVPEIIESAREDDLRACGLSRRKVEYLTSVAGLFSSGALDDRRLRGADDDEVRSTLCAVRGIGPWTAEMFLIFHLRRPDVLPLGDIGLHRAARALYGWPPDEGSAETKRRLSELGDTWRPWRTVAVWYLWRELDAEPVIY